MRSLIVVENPARWPFAIPGVEVVTARAYLVDPQYAELRRAAVYNLCRHYGYQRLGYYVSLLAAARGHRPLPSIDTIQLLRSAAGLRTLSSELERMVERALAPLKSDSFVLSVYFGRNPAKRYDRLSQALFNQFPAPLLRATFVRDDGWHLQSIRLIATADIPDFHTDFVLDRATQFFSRPMRRIRTGPTYRYDLAILWDPDEAEPPSGERAIHRFIRAARQVGIDAETVDSDDYSRVAEYDALFIRQTTFVPHVTYRFAQRAAAERLVVIDDPESIVRCTNKVYLAELFARHRISAPPTVVVDEVTAGRIAGEIGFPCVLKRPDSSFSQGVVKVANEDALRRHLGEMFKTSELVVAQAFTPSPFDWRIGVLDGRAFFACKYHMASGHWQIIAGGPRRRYGAVEAVPLSEAPPVVVAAAEQAAGLIGHGLYGVDVKEVNGQVYVIEVNDNPNIDAGYEDTVLGAELYLVIMRWFRERLDARGAPLT